MAMKKIAGTFNKKEKLFADKEGVIQNQVVFQKLNTVVDPKRTVELVF